MQLNDDLSRAVIVPSVRQTWVPSPIVGIERRMLFRIGAEKARATTIVRYVPGSRFARHAHPGGEEFLVLEGTFQDESGDFPVGTYVRNPPGTAHAPGSETGCTILVKLWQFGQDDQTRIVCRPNEGEAAPLRSGVSKAQVLYASAAERVMMESWQPDADVEIANPDGLELLVLDGVITAAGEELDRWSWLRLPASEALRVRVGREGARVWYKAAPLLHGDVCRFDA